MNRERIDVGIAECVVAHNPAVLVTKGLGSCVAVLLRDSRAKVGAMVHIVLPSMERSSRRENPFKFADSGIETAIDEMRKMGCSINRMEAKIAGGACMFHFDNMTINIGTKNVSAVMQKLDELGIPVIAYDTGGDYGRTVEFDIADGSMMVKTALFGVRKM